MLLEELADILDEGQEEGESFVKIAPSSDASKTPFTKTRSIYDLSIMLNLIPEDEEIPAPSLEVGRLPSSTKVVDAPENPISDAPKHEQLLRALALRAVIADKNKNAALQKSSWWLRDLSKSEKTDLSDLLAKAQSLGLKIRSAKLETLPDTASARLSNAAAQMLQESDTKNGGEKGVLFAATLSARNKKESKAFSKLSAPEISLGHLLKKEEKPGKTATTGQRAPAPTGKMGLESLLTTLDQSKTRKKSHHAVDKADKNGRRIAASPIETAIGENDAKQTKEKPLAKSSFVHSGPKGPDVSIAAQAIQHHHHRLQPASRQSTESTIDATESQKPDHSLPKEADLAAPVSMSKSHANKMLTQKIVDARASVHHFANRLNEEIENYKPPFTRLKMQMDPKDLGNVEVTMISRGNQLHIQVHSNPTAIGLMATQGSELKSQLVSMGFTDVQMQFNMNQQQQQQERRRQASQNGGYVSVEEIPDFYESLDLIIPQYV